MNPADITPPAIQCVYKPFPVYYYVHQANANANTACYNRPAVNPPSMMVLMFSFCWNCFRDALIRLVWSFLGESTLFRGVCSIFTNERRRDNSNMIVRNNHKVESDPAVWPSGRDDLLQDSCINLSVPNKLTHTHSSTVRLRNSSSWSSAEHILLRCDIFSHPFQTLSTCCSCSASSSSSSSTTCLGKPGGSCMSKQEVIV